MQQTSSSIAKLSFDEDKLLLHIIIDADAIMDMKNLADHYSKIEQITEGEKYMALVDVSQPYFIDNSGIKYASDPSILKNRIAAAYYNPPLSNRLNLMGLRKCFADRIPTFIATEKKIALKWLGSIKM